MSFILPESDDPEKVKAWRYRVAILLFLVFLLIGALPFFLETRYAVAAQEAEIHDKLSKEIAGVTEAVEDLTKTFQQTEAARQAREKEVAIREIRTLLFQTQKDACLQSGRLREVLMESVENLKTQFMSLTGTEYPSLDCSNFKTEK